MNSTGLLKMKMDEENASKFRNKLVTDFQISHYLFQTADRLKYVNDFEFIARIMLHFSFSYDQAVEFYYPWKHNYMEALREQMEREDNYDQK